jgi:uncharacterized membrane protein
MLSRNFGPTSRSCLFTSVTHARSQSGTYAQTAHCNYLSFFLAKSANSRGNHNFLDRVSTCFQEVTIGLRIAKPQKKIEEKSHRRDHNLRSDEVTLNQRRTIVAELIVVGFKKDMYRASEVLNELMGLNDDWVVDLHDAVAVYRDYSGKLRVDQSFQMTTGEGAAWGGFWGLLIGATLAIPFTAGASAAATAGAVAAGALGGTAIGAGAGAVDASSWKDEFGIPDDFVQRVGTMVQPGDSAIYAILRVGSPDVVADRFRGYGGTILRTTLSRDQQAKVEKVLSNSAR